jgi:hypothetical protein
MNIMNIIKQRYLIISVLLFLTLFIIVNSMKPGWLYNNDGSIKQFGIGYRKKTIYPIWIFAITLSILCYLMILFYVNYN